MHPSLRPSTPPTRTGLRPLFGTFRALAPRLALAVIWSSCAGAGAPSPATPSQPSVPVPAVPTPAAAGASAAPAKLPAFRPGLWEYRRTVAGDGHNKPQAMQTCSDPSEDIQRKLGELRKKGCQFSPLTQHGNRFQSSWTCPTSNGVFEIRDVITVMSASSYQNINEVHDSTRTVRSTTVANRLGECAPAAKTSVASPQRIGAVAQQ